MEKRMCELYDRECIDCGECEFCDLDPIKICDNCGKCLDVKEFATFKIDNIDGVELSRERASTPKFSAKKFYANKSLKRKK